MKASTLIKAVDEIVPPELACIGDTIGFQGPGDPHQIEVREVLLLMDYVSGVSYTKYDLVILHHPPPVLPDFPVYVIHSNWDIVRGGAADALAETLDIWVDDELLPSGIGRIGRLKDGPTSVRSLLRMVQTKLCLDEVRIVSSQDEQMVHHIGLVPGFGLNPEIIRAAHERGVELLLSGDLTHPGAILAGHLGIILIDATHHATEIPGLNRLASLISRFGVSVHLLDTGIPWRNERESDLLTCQP